MNLSSKQSLIAIVVLAVICLFLGIQLFVGGEKFKDLSGDYGRLEMDKEQVVFDLEKMRFSYDTLNVENSMMLAEISAQRDKIDGLITSVKNGNWELGKAKKEAATLRVIMKGYIVTIDSINQLNQALTEENTAMRDRVKEVQGKNEKLKERQENMEEIIEAGRLLQCTEINVVGIRVLSSGRQRETTRADRVEMIKVCFTLLENKISEPGNKVLNLRIKDLEGTVLLSNDDGSYSATRNIDYSNDRLDACVFYSVNLETSALISGEYTVEILEQETPIGSSILILR
jgi:FtsZ-binding cell division protein ZapB